jgi:clan AA aspartic protease (TIGR02281 family)
MIKVDPRERSSFEKPRHIPLAVIIVTVIIAIGCGGFYYWYAFLQKSNYSEVYRQLGISKMPSTLELQPTVQAQLDQLSHEPCYRDAILGLADTMLDAGYPRDADTSLSNFAKRCGEADELLLRRYRAKAMASDFLEAAKIANILVQSNPADAQIRYWRGNAYEELKDFQRALTDYINSVQLLGEPETVSINTFYAVSRMYAALHRYCDAITPIETYISFDPANRRTTQTTKLVAEYVAKGNCDARYASGSTRVSRLALPGMSGMTLLVVINDTPGNFLLDTGASYVAVTPEFASKAKLKMEGGTQLPIKTVAGIASADLGYASTVSVGKAEAQGVSVAVIRGAVDPFGSRLDGLLGMSFLARFKISLSQNTLELTAIPLQSR